MNQTPRHRAISGSSNSTEARRSTEWIEYGLRQFEIYLEKHRRSSRYRAADQSHPGSGSNPVPRYTFKA